MLIITDTGGLAAAMASPLPQNIKDLLALRRDQFLLDTNGEYDLGELAHWVIVAPGDTIPAIEAAVKYPILPDPPWEWVLDHGGLFEAPIIFSDDGFGVVLIVPNDQGIDMELLTLLRREAVPAPTSVADAPSANADHT